MVKKTKKDRRLRFTWTSNGHWTNSGYGVFTRDFLTRLVKDGWPLAEIAFFGLQGYSAKIDGIHVYPQMAESYGTDAMFHHSKDWKANVAFCMQDIWVANPHWLMELNKNNIVFIPYLPIDQEPVAPMILERLKLAYRIITFSKFGQQALEKHGFASTLILEGTDPQIFKPIDKMRARMELGIPVNRFVFGMIAANKENPPRKGYQEILEALKLFVKNHPEGILFIHSQQIAGGGFPIREYAKHLEVDNHIMIYDQYKASFGSDSHAINKELNAFDVTMNASQTEGFGLGIIESQSAGIPVIVNNCHSMPELIIEGKTGEICDINYDWWRNQQGFVHTANPKSLHSKMETLYKKLKEKNTIERDCRDNVLQNYDINDIVRDRWIPFLNNLQEELLGKPKE